MLRIAFLISGTGTNLQYIIDKINEKELDCVIKMVTRANLQGIPSYVLDKNTYGENIGDEIIKIIKDKVDLIVLGGFLSILKGEILDRYKDKIINIHPSLIPKFCGKGMYGIKVHEAVLNSGDKITGCTLHFVSRDVDMGTIILQKSLNITGEESPKTLQEKVLKEEHRCLLEGIRLISEGKV